MKVWLNGVVADASDARLSPFDHGFTVGDGVFETCKVIGGQPYALSRHLKRLARSASGLSLSEPDQNQTRKAIAELLVAEPTAGRLRITYTAGPGPLGSERGTEGTTLVIAATASSAWEETAKVAVVPWVRNERSAVAGLKTTSYAENVVALTLAHERGASEALFYNTRDELCEGTGSNVFVVIDDRIRTPPLSSGCLDGVTRQLVLECTDVEEALISPFDFARATEAFLTSSTRDVQPIGFVDDRELAGASGSVTAAVRKSFLAQQELDIDP